MRNLRRPTLEVLEACLEHHRAELTAYCCRTLASSFEAEDAVQETFVRAWRGLDGFEGRGSLRAWLYRIATNVCLQMLSDNERRARPTGLGPARDAQASNLSGRSQAPWVEHIPDAVAPEADPADAAVAHETIRLAFLSALQHLPPRQRGVLFLCEVLRWKATEVAELLDTTVASVNSALQRARRALATRATDAPTAIDDAQRRLLARYLGAFEACDIVALTSLIKEDAAQPLPGRDPWLRGRERTTAARESAQAALATRR